MGSLIGSVRRFGLDGPPYEVTGIADAGPAGEARMRIHLLESNEDADYPVEDILTDPTDG
ncbi:MULTISPECIES: DUF5397 family protein [unclassified Sphingomonas]|uniref:DUF5397 family protein n=1 Tax=unclassified Sphingomonas TaxID=196159 RepID=UPI001F5A7AC8|nr:MULTISPECIES: DUF5397 family protein [unclassified Sphingomonas]